MKFSPAFFRTSLLAAGVALLPARSRAQDVGAGTPIVMPTPAGVIVRPDLAYDAHPRQQLDLYLPTGRLAKLRPVIVYIHGGGWLKGSKADGRRLAFRFAAQGYAVACIDYRLSGDAGFPAQVEDCKAAVRWLRANADRYGLDRDHIGVVGVSAGGHLAALVGAMNSARLYESGAGLDQNSHVQAVCDFFGPVDLLGLFEASQQLGTPQAGEIAQLLGGDPHRVPVPTSASNPILFADGESPPFLIIHGDQDTVVPPAQSRMLYDALVRKHLCAHLHIIHGAGHTGPAFVAPEINAIVDEFFARTLNQGNQPPEKDSATLTESNAAEEIPGPRTSPAK